MESTLQLSGSVKGSEERDVLFGRLFACGALVRSGRVPLLPGKRRATVVAKLTSQLFSCAAAKAFLQEPAAAITCEFVKTLSAADVQATVWPKLAPLLARPMAEWAPHALLMALSMTRTLPTETVAEFLPHCEVHLSSAHSATPRALPFPPPPLSRKHPSTTPRYTNYTTYPLERQPNQGRCSQGGPMHQIGRLLRAAKRSKAKSLNAFKP